MLNLLMLNLLLLISCANTDKEVYKLETTLLDNTIDTFNLEVRYNKELRKLELEK